MFDFFDITLTKQSVVGLSWFLGIFVVFLFLKYLNNQSVYRGCCSSCEVGSCPCMPAPHPVKKLLTLKAVFENSFTIMSLQGIQMSIVARNDQVITFSPVFEDEYGNKVSLDTKPTWSLSNPEVATLQVSEDGLSAVVTPVGLVGSVQLNVLIDADPSQGVEPLVGVADITIVGGKVKTIRLTGVVSDKASAPVAPSQDDVQVV